MRLSFIGLLLCSLATLPAAESAALPTLLDLGSVTCIPCKKMAPILESMEKEYAGKLVVKFIDVNADPAAANTWRIELIPTQIFLSADGKELFRHQGFFSREDILAKWQELGVALGTTAAPAMLKRLEPATADTRKKESVCHLCDHDIPAVGRVVINAPAGKVPLCSMHCWAVYHSCFAEAAKLPAMTTVQIADGSEVALQTAAFLYGADAQGRPTIVVYASREAAMTAAAKTPGMMLDWQTLLRREQSTRCGFCDRAVYPEDAAAVKVEGLFTYGCCAHCAMGVAARLRKDVVIDYPDNQTGETVRVVTQDLKIATVTPPTAVAWSGKRRTPDGKFVSAGCFHQGFFTSLEHLQAWLAAHPAEIGEQISFQQSLDDKLKLNAEQVQKACKIGECKPR